MNEEFVIDENELSEAINKIILTIETLEEAIDNCGNELIKATECGIVDCSITTSILELEQKISGNKTTLAEVKEMIENIKIGLINDMKSNDNFIFPVNAMDGLFSLNRWPNL